MKTKFVVLKVNFFVLFFLLFPSAIWTYGLPHLPNEEAQRILHSVKIIRNKTHNIIGGRAAIPLFSLSWLPPIYLLLRGALYSYYVVDCYLHQLDSAHKKSHAIAHAHASTIYHWQEQVIKIFVFCICVAYRLFMCIRAVSLWQAEGLLGEGALLSHRRVKSQFQQPPLQRNKSPPKIHVSISKRAHARVRIFTRAHTHTYIHTRTCAYSHVHAQLHRGTAYTPYVSLSCKSDYPL